MKKFILFAFLIIFSFSASNAFAINPDPKSKSENPAIPDKKENKLSDEEISRLTKRVEEIRDMDKTNLSVKEKRALKKEVKAIKENVRKDDVYVISGTTLLILIIILLCL
jgi:hypothetical protein